MAKSFEAKVVSRGRTIRGAAAAGCHKDDTGTATRSRRLPHSAHCTHCLGQQCHCKLDFWPQRAVVKATGKAMVPVTGMTFDAPVVEALDNVSTLSPRNDRNTAIFCHTPGETAVRAIKSPKFLYPPPLSVPPRALEWLGHELESLTQRLIFSHRESPFFATVMIGFTAVSAHWMVVMLEMESFSRSPDDFRGGKSD